MRATAAAVRTIRAQFIQCLFLVIHFQSEAHFTMPTEVQRLDDLHAIRRYVNETLCEKDRLEANCFPLCERTLVRGGRPCGLIFFLYGPRSLCLTAIWETDSNTILFYGSRGERFRKTQLVAPPRIDQPLETAD